MDYLTAHTSLSPIRRGFAPAFVNYKIWCTRLAAASDKVYQLLAYGRWFSPGTPPSSTTKTGRHDIVESGVKHKNNPKIQSKIFWPLCCLFFFDLRALITPLVSSNSSYITISCFCITLSSEPCSWRGVLDTTLCDKVCQWLATGRWFSPSTPVSSTNKTDRHNIIEILLIIALNTINLNQTLPIQSTLTLKIVCSGKNKLDKKYNWTCTP